MKRLLIMAGMAALVGHGHAQNKKQGSPLDEFKQSAKKEFSDFSRQNKEDYRAFRQQMMQEYIDFVRQPWQPFQERKAVAAPKDEEDPPVEMADGDEQHVANTRPVKVEAVIAPPPAEPQPTPPVPIEATDAVAAVDAAEWTIGFQFFGTQGQVRFNAAHLPQLRGTDEGSVANALANINAQPQDYDNMILDCLQLRERHALSDWAYLLMLKALSERIAGTGTNESVLLLSYLYMQSGYKMRIATDRQRLYMLYASQHTIFDQGPFYIDDSWYYGLEELPSRLYICQAAFPQERELSLYINRAQRFDSDPSQRRTIASRRYGDMQLTCTVNRNLISFYDTYPTSMVGGNMMSRWAMYANTPLAADVKQQLYPVLRHLTDSLTRLEAVGRLLNWVQTGFVYGYDNQVWGHDRAFFAEESLYYPFCDCEDRAILFTRLVRDIVGLDCLLVYYPGHLAAAVAFDDDSVRGDYIVLHGRRFVITDPTYIGAPVGTTMRGKNNRTAKVIVLNR